MNSKSLSRLTLPLIIIVMGIMIVIPVGALVFGSFWSSRPGAPGHFTLENYVDAFSDVRSIRLLTNSLAFAFGSGLLATSVATVLAFVTTRTDTPLSRFFTYIPFLPLIVPGIVENLAWIYLLRPKTGLINIFLMDTLGLSAPPFNIYTLWGMIWVMGLALVPLAFVAIRGALVSLDPALEDAARVSGRGVRPVIFRITLPLIFPAILSIFLLTFIISFEAFETPAMIGIPGNIDVYMGVIYYSIASRLPPEHGLATSQAMVMLAITMIMVYLYRRSTKRAEKFAVITGRGYAPRIMKIGKWRYFGLAILLTYLFVNIILPFFTLIIISLKSFWNPRDLFGNLTLQNYADLLTHESLLPSFFNSILASSVSATIAVLVASIIAYYSLKTRVKRRGVLEGVSMLPISFPGLVLGVGLLWAFITLPIYGTIWVLIIAFIIKYIPHGVRFVSVPLLQIHRELEDASRISGASILYTLRRIVLALLRPALLGGWVYVAMISFRELGTVVLLVSPQNQVISFTLFNMWYIGYVEKAVAASMVLVAVLWSLVIIGSLISKARLRFQPTP
ncbi:MAG: ABC transporter permease [Nitrososphaerales archaeon]